MDAREEAIAFYRTVQDYERHFNSLEFEVRKLASAWLLASFAAIAFIVRGDIDAGRALLSGHQLLALIALLAQCGLFSLWTLDQIVYHRLLDAVFTTTLHIERAIPELPQLRTTMLRYAGGTGVARYLTFFYLLPMAIFAAIGWIAVLGARLSMPWLAVAGLTTLLPLWVAFKQWSITRAQLAARPGLDWSAATTDRPWPQ